MPMEDKAYSKIIFDEISAAADKYFVCGVFVCECKKGLPCIYINEALLNSLGYEECGEEHLLSELIHPMDRELVSFELIHKLGVSEKYEAKFRFIKSDGTDIWYKCTGIKINENDETIITGSCIDASDSVELSKIIDAKNYEREEFLNSLPCGICKIALNDSLSICYANAFFYNMLGFGMQSLLLDAPRSLNKICHNEDFYALKECIKSNIANRKNNFEFKYRCVRRDGSIFWAFAQFIYEPYTSNCITFAAVDISSVSDKLDRLKTSENEMLLAMSLSDSLICTYDISSKTLINSHSLDKKFAMPQRIDNFPQAILDAGYVEKESVSDFKRVFKEMAAGQEFGSAACILYSVKGPRWISIKYSLAKDFAGNPEKAVIAFTDITEEQKREEAERNWRLYFESQRMASETYCEYNLTKDCIEFFDSEYGGNIPYGYQESGISFISYIADHFVFENDKCQFINFFDRVYQIGSYYNGTHSIRLEYRKTSLQGRIYWVAAFVNIIKDTYTGDIKSFIFVQNIDKQKKDTLKREELINKDYLTGLLNRRAINESVNSIIALNSDVHHAFVIMDLDYFKSVNDNYGHIYGDNVLVEFANVISSVIRTNDVCGRLGGDEFIIFLKDINRKIVQEKMESLRLRIFNTSDEKIPCTCSIGVAIFPEDGITFNDLYYKADIALYAAKTRGRNRFEIYDSSMEVKP